MKESRQIAPSALTAAELEAEFHELRAAERDVSYQRRLMHGRIDVIRAEISTRVTADGPRSDSLQDMVERLSTALTHSGPPDIVGELEKLGAKADSGVEIRFPGLESELPDLVELTEEELAGMVLALCRREREISARRQEVLRRLDLVRGERVARLQTTYQTTGEE